MSASRDTPTRSSSLSFLGPPEPVEDWVALGGATDSELAGLLHALRRYIRGAPDGMWPLDVVRAAKTLTEAVAGYLREADEARGCR